MRRHERWIACCAVLWLSACCSTLPRPVGPDNEARREAAVRTRWVGVTRLGSGSCPVPRTSGWTVRPLFPLQGLEPKARESAREARLHRFCVYEYQGGAPVPGLPREISARLRSVEPDRVALSGAASLEEMTSIPFYERFREQVQIRDDLPAAGTSRVRLAFLDTQPDGEGVPRIRGSSPHGYALTHIAGHLAGPLACRDSRNSCAVEVASRLVLPLAGFDPEKGQELVRDESSGGFRGTFDDLSRALWAEILRWQETPRSQRPPHLVLNLSVGWDGEKLGGWEERLPDMSPGVQAVYRALKAAADQDILVIAATGNEMGGPQPTGRPLLPAGWEQQAQLSRRGGLWRRSGEPLLYAASGVDGRDHPLVNTRAQGEAPRVAYADHVAVPEVYEPESEFETRRHTATLTGTSVASAVVSTIAAVVWSYRPELTRAEVMETLSRSGKLLPRRHDFSSLSDPAPGVRRISLCEAVSQAWRTSRTHRPPLDCAAAKPDPIDLSAFRPEIKSTAGLPPSPPVRHPDLREEPWIGPQPGVDPCPNCAVDPPDRQILLAPAGIAVVADASPRSYGSTEPPLTSRPSRLLVEVPGGWAAGDLQGATLELFGFDPETGRKVLLSSHSIATPPLLRGGDTLAVTFVEPAEPFQAILSFILNPPRGAPEGTTIRSVASPLFVD